MPIAFVLVTTELGFEEDVLRQIRALSGVKEAHFIYGMYDVMVEIEGSTDTEVDEQAARIRKLDKINSTQTLIAP